MKHIITIGHWLPTSDNKLKSHWAVSNRLKKADANTIWKHMLIDRVPSALNKRRVEVLIMCKPIGRMPDPSNYAKSLLDALVKCRLIIDDSQRWCGYVTPVIERGTKQAWGTSIILTDMEDA